MSDKIVLNIGAKGLLGSIDLYWSLKCGVNILSGGNGSGKSTLLRAVAQKLRTGSIQEACMSLISQLDIAVSSSPLNVLSNFDMAQIDQSSLYGVDSDQKETFYDIIDNLFHATGKKVDRGGGELKFLLGNLSIPVVALSSGERQVLRIFMNVLLNSDADILILDEPEISLQIEWQKVLLEGILSLNPDLQILVATHSPAIVMDGWVDCVSEISSLVVKGASVN